MQVDITLSPAAEDARELSQGLIEYNNRMFTSAEGADQNLPFSIFLRDDEGSICGGIRASCYWNILDVELVWVAESVRGRSWGTQLMRAAEQFAREQGMGKALITTTDWQAKPFYEKLGYQVFGALEDHPRGHTCFYMSKSLF